VVPEPAALAAAVADCLADPGPYGGFGEAGAAYVREAFSWTRNAAILGLIPA
jgi:glycosyltransferase involved in cell wall biosynthesis